MVTCPVSLERNLLFKLCRCDRRIAVVFAIALAALFASPSTRADAAPWGVPEEVSAPGGSASWSQVGVDATGDATSIWTRSNGLSFVLQAAERPAGGSWGVPADISGTEGSAENLALAVDSAGDVVAAWKQRLSGSEAIETAYKPAGGAWGPAEAVEFGATVVETPAVAIDGAGDAVIVWRQALGGNHVVMTTSRPAGGAWAAPVALSNSALNTEAPDVAMSPAGTADAVWQASNGAFSLVESSILPLGGVMDRRRSDLAAGDRHRTAAYRGQRGR